MVLSRRFVRGLFIVLLVVGCVALAIAPILPPASAARQSIPSVFQPDVVISQFRFNGPNGEPDEFIEIVNRSGDNINLDGWSLKASKGSNTGADLYDFSGPNAITLISGHYFLLLKFLPSPPPDGTPGYSGPIPSDPATYGKYFGGISGANGGVALVDNNGNVQDQVGVTTDGYHEGAALAPLTGTADQAYKRKVDTTGSNAGQYVDTDNNKQDFELVTPADPQNGGSTPAPTGIPTQTISGTTTIGGAILKFTDGTAQTATTDANGLYTLTVRSNWSGTVTPFLKDTTFAPPKMSYTNVMTDQANQDYTSTTSTATPTRPAGYLSIIINEIAWAGTQYTTSDQWIELYNPNARNINLKDWELIGASGTIGTITNGQGILTLTGVIPANGFYVIAKRSDVFQDLPAGVTLQVDGNLSLSTYGEALTLDSNKGLLIDTANHTQGRWPAGSSTYYYYRASMERHSPTADIPSNWYTFAGTPPRIVHDRGGYVIKGTPGQRNWAYTVTATVAPTATRYKTPTPRPPTPFAHMVLNEFLPRAGTDWNQDKSVDVFDEFIEVKNLGPIDVDLRGWKLDVISSGGNSSFILPSTKLTTGQRAVFYRLTTKVGLPDSGGTVRLTNTRGIVIDARGYGPVVSPDQSVCRIPDGLYWRFPCFPTPGNENSLTGIFPAPPPSTGNQPPPCLMADIVPAPFRQAECYGFGGDVYNAKYWDDQSGFNEFPVMDMLNKWRAIVK